MLDNVIDVSNYPLDQHRQEALNKRRIGLGVTGLADALIMCRARYGSDEAVALVHKWCGLLRREAYLASVDLAKEKGPFPLFDADAYLAGEGIQALDVDVQQAIREHGIRNALVTSIAPTGTISLLANNISSGLEPVFSFAYTRKVLRPDGGHDEEEIVDYAVALFREKFGPDAQLPEYMVNAQTLAPEDHVRMQAGVQQYIDSSISKTINVPEDISFEDLEGVYLQAYDLGCKGCTTFRPNDITGTVLDVSKPTEAPVPASSTPVNSNAPLARPEELPGSTYKVRWPDSDHAMYITVNDTIQDGQRRPFEVFINSKNMDHFAWTVALTRMISAVFRRGGDVAFVVEELQAVFDPRGGQWMGGRYVPSLLAAIGDVIERHLVAIGFVPPKEVAAAAVPAPEVPSEGLARPIGRTCPGCGQPTLVRKENCDGCSCGYSRC
jgi:ribonucleoside-diphosphate reductase alpha chain